LSIDRLSAALTDHYRIERELGAGGMATVYLAHDLKHDRDVAIKVLHPDLGAALGAERFLTEIKTTAKLHHPHILALLDSGAVDGLLFYVMPYVRGETLRDRLQRETQLPVNDALRIAREVADALGAAHELGIIHRDIKPENILLQGEHALVADFGIALAVQQAGGARMTQTGLSLGTPQYMAPEQAMGDRTVDARVDIYALGAVTYEMLTGEPPHTGANAQSIVAKLLTEPVRPVSVLRPAVPPFVDDALQVALQKLPADRYATVKEFADALRGGTGTRTLTPAARSSFRARASRWLPVAVALDVVLAAGIVLAWLRHAPEPPVSRQPVVLWHTAVTPALAPGATFVANQAAISPDGETIVYTDSTNGWQLMRKRRNVAAPEAIEGTQGAVSPFFSPDGAWIGFVTLDGRIEKIATAGGTPIVVTEDAGSEWKAAAWLDDGSIVYVSTGALLSTVPATGRGTPRRLHLPTGTLATVFSLAPLPGSKGVLVSLCRGNCAFSSDVFVYDFTTDSARVLVPKAIGAWYSPTGHLLFTGRDGGLFAAAFDLSKMQLRSEPVPVLDGVAAGQFALSASGSIIYAFDAGVAQPSELMWVSRDGRATPYDSTWKAGFDYPAISPDGKSVAVSTRDRTTDLWIHRDDGSRRKVIAPLAGAWRPSWLPDGKSLLFVGFGDPSVNVNDVTVWRVGADASTGLGQFLRHRYPIFEAEVSPDTQYIVFRADEEIGSGNIYARRLHGDSTLIPVATGPSNDYQVAIAPDGRKIAYASTEGGVQQVFVQSFPDGKIKRLASRGRGYEPRWSRSGRELFFESVGRLMVVDVGSGDDIEVGEPRALFSLAGYRRARNRPQYDVAPGDQRFLMIKDPPLPAIPSVVYVEHWFPELLAKVKK